MEKKPYIDDLYEKLARVETKRVTDNALGDNSGSSLKHPRGKQNERILLEKLDNMMEYTGAEYLFTLPQILEAMLSDENFSEIVSDIKANNNLRFQEEALQGYKLAIGTCLFNLLDTIVRNPRLIGVKFDDTFYDYWAFTKEQGRDKLSGGGKRGNDLPGLTTQIQILSRQLLQIRDFDGLRNYKQVLAPLSNSLLGIRDNHFPTCMDLYEGKVIESKRYLTKRAPNTIRKNLLNSNIAIHVYSELFRKHIGQSSNPNLPEDEEDGFESENLTRFDDDWREDMEHTPAPDRWAFGFAFALTKAMECLASPYIGKRIESYYKSRYPVDTWERFDSYELGLDNIFGHLPGFESMIMIKTGCIIRKERSPLISCEKVNTDENSFILSRMGNRARIVDRDSPSAVFSFGCLLKGSVDRAKRRKEKVLVASVTHPIGNRRYNYSFGILMPARGAYFSNSSIWWIFYDIADNWNDEGLFQFGKILNLIDRNAKNIDLLKITASKEKFYEFCEDPGYIRLRQQISSITNLQSRVRGAFPELILALYLAKQDAYPIRTRLKPYFLGKELDVIGCLRNQGGISEVVVFESKGKSITDKDLDLELTKFEERIRLVNSKWEDIAKVLGVFPIPIPRINAIFVSMATINSIQDINVPKGITLWDFRLFVQALKKQNIPEEYFSLLQEKYFIYEGL